LGFLNYDKSGGFITIPDNFVMFTKRDKAEILDEVFLFIKNSKDEPGEVEND
jgi:hypothetical protein